MPATKGLDTCTLCYMLIPLKDSSYCVCDWISEEIAMFKISLVRFIPLDYPSVSMVVPLADFQ
jgi:hypothetical protein